MCGTVDNNMKHLNIRWMLDDLYQVKIENATFDDQRQLHEYLSLNYKTNDITVIKNSFIITKKVYIDFMSRMDINEIFDGFICPECFLHKGHNNNCPNNFINTDGFQYRTSQI